MKTRTEAATERVIANAGRLLTPKGAAKGTQRVPIRVCRYYRLPSGRLSFNSRGAHVTEEILIAPLHLPGIINALARRLRHRFSATLAIDLNHYGLSAGPSGFRRKRAGSIAKIYVDYLIAPTPWRKDEDLSMVIGEDQWTRVPSGARDCRIAMDLVHALSEEELAQPWRCHKPRQTAAQRDFSRRSKALAQLMSLIIAKPGKRQLTTAQAERLVVSARKVAKPARAA